MRFCSRAYKILPSGGPLGQTVQTDKRTTVTRWARRDLGLIIIAIYNLIYLLCDGIYTIRQVASYSNNYYPQLCMLA